MCRSTSCSRCRAFAFSGSCALTRERLLDRWGHGINHYTYRLSEKGREYLSLLLSRAQVLPPLTDRELALEESP